MAEELVNKIEEYFNFVNSVSGRYIYFDEVLPAAKEFTPAPRAINTPVAKAVSTQAPVVSATVQNIPVKRPMQEVKPISPAPREKEIVQTPTQAINIEAANARTYIGGDVDSNWKESTNLEELYGKIHKCLQCSLGPTRNKFVFGSGSPTADIMIIGEAPGAEEDAQGLPFIGRAGQLLTKILEAINLQREDVFICNIIKCRPPANRRPTTQEVDACEPYLIKQIEIIKPKFILALGLTAVDTLFKANHKMGDVRGKIMKYNGIDTLITYHPAALLRNPGWKKLAWEDVKLLRKLYDEFLESDI